MPETIFGWPNEFRLWFPHQGGATLVVACACLVLLFDDVWLKVVERSMLALVLFCVGAVGVAVVVVVAFDCCDCCCCITPSPFPLVPLLCYVVGDDRR